MFSYRKVTSNRFLTWLPVAFKTEGLCYSTTIPETFTKAGIINLEITLFSNNSFKMETSGVFFTSRGWRIMLHRRGQTYRSNTVPLTTLTNFETSVFVHHTVFRKMNGSEDCTPEMNDKYDDCWYKNVQMKLMDHLGCIYPWNKNVLTESDRDIICNDKSAYETPEIENLVLSEMRDLDSHNCTTPCEFLSFSSTTPIETKSVQDYGTLSIDFDEEVQVIEEFLVYDALSMVGEASGYLGLFLGISCYQVTLILLDKIGQERSEKRKCKKTTKTGDSH